VDGAEGKSHNDVSALTFSPDSKRIAYKAWDEGKGALVVIDGVESKAYVVLSSDDLFSDIAFSPDSKHVVYGAKKARGGVIVLDGVESGQRHYGARCVNFTFSPDSARLAYVVRERDQSSVVLDGVAGPAYSRIISCCFSPDSRHFAYVVDKGNNKFVVVVDGVEGAEYGSIVEGSLTFSPDSEHVAYVGSRDDAWRIVVDGVESASYLETNSRIVFTSPDRAVITMVKLDANDNLQIVDVEFTMPARATEGAAASDPAPPSPPGNP
jgi:Tol biopolymer transport system component